MAYKMQQDQGDHVMHRHCLAAFINRTNAISISIRSETNQCFRLEHFLLENPEVAVNGLGVNSTAEKRVATDSYGFDIKVAARQKTFDPVAAGPVHRIDDDHRRRAAHAFEIDFTAIWAR